MDKKEKTVSLPWFGIPRLFPYIKKYRKKLILMAVLGIGASLLDSIMPLFNRYVLDHFVAENTLDTLGVFIGLYIAAILIKVACDFTSTYTGGKVEMSVNRDLRNASFRHLQTLSFSYFNRNSVGYIHARVMSDTEKIGTLVAWRMMDFVWNVSFIICVFVSMYLLNVRLAVYVTILVPVAVLVITFFQKKLLVLNHRIREQNSKITGNFNEGIT
jgi:ATP-binding cassette subfamily B protein